MRFMGSAIFYHYGKRQRVWDTGKYDIVMPDNMTPPRSVPAHIKKPIYYNSNKIDDYRKLQPDIKSDDDILKMRDSCKLASTILKGVKDMLKIGVTTDDIDAYVHEECIKNNAYPSPLYYKGFPKSCCTSVNNVVCHGVPDLRPLANGDIVTVDITVYYQGFHGDCSKTYVVGKPDFRVKRLIETLEGCMEKALLVCYDGAPISDIGYVIDEYACRRNMTVISAVAGHGIGKYFHGYPEIYHMRNLFRGTMKKGMTFTIEPALTIGLDGVRILYDGWTTVTKDDSRCAQMEHTILVTDHDCEVLTE